jgi:hypothetical protein
MLGRARPPFGNMGPELYLCRSVAYLSPDEARCSDPLEMVVHDEIFNLFRAESPVPTESSVALKSARVCPALDRRCVHLQ